MSNPDELKSSIAKNLAFYRKQKNLTQLELAEMLNYSDKAVSKWERGESVPDVTVLKQLADFYNITIDALTSDTPSKNSSKSIHGLLTKHKLIIPFLAAGLVWFVATVIYVFFMVFGVEFRAWLIFIYAIPLSLIVLMVFNSIWGYKILSAIIISILIWSIAVCIVLSVELADAKLFFIIPAPMQILVVLWYIMRITKKPKTPQ